MFRRRAMCIAACLAMLACGSAGQITHTDIPPLGGAPASFDQVLIDPSSHRLYIADGTDLGLDVFDVSTSKAQYLTTIKVGKAPKGLAAAPDLHKVFAGLEGGAVAVVESDPTSPRIDTLLTKVQTSAQKNVDLVEYDPADRLLIAVSGDDGLVTSIDAIRNVVVGHLSLPVGLEQPRFDKADGLIYLTNLKKNEVYAIDPRRLRLLNTWPVGMPCGATGLALDPSSGQAVIGCTDPKVAYSLAWNLHDGKVAKTLTEVADVDQAIYEPATQRFLLAGSYSGKSAVGVYRTNPVEFEAAKVTTSDSRAVAYDSAVKLVYTPSRHPGSVGLLSFPVPKAEAQLPSFLTPLLYLLILLSVGLVVWYYGARRARARRLAGRPGYS
jgi:DNA-binding beta-propeller fold protein YncE